MAGGPITPFSALPVTAGKVFENVHIGAGANSKHDVGFGVMASVDGNSIWRLRFATPPTLPSGTGKLLIRSLAAASTGVAKINPQWVSVNTGEDPSSATLNALGTTTVTWGAGDNDDYKDTKITLTGDTLTGGETVVMDLVMETSGWTLGVVSTHQFFVIWE